MQTLRSVFMWTIKKQYLYFSVKYCINYMRGLIFLFFSFNSFSNPPPLNYLYHSEIFLAAPSPSTVTKHNLLHCHSQHSHFFILYLFPLSHITCRRSVRIHYFLKIQFIDIFFFLLSSSSLQTFILCVILN